MKIVYYLYEINIFFNLKGFYRGMVIIIVLTIPKTAVRFSANEFLKNHVFTVYFY